jgi:glutamate synthase domain-containing protein 3
MTAPAGERPVPIVSVPDIRDYERINTELVVALDDGHARVRLVGAEGQRLLAAGLAGPWRAVIEVEGRAGPELAAGLNAPGLTLVCRGPAADGAGRALRAGTLVLAGDCGPALGYALEGGAVVAAGAVGPRAGLNQRGGLIVVLGAVGRLAAERQAGGLFFARDDRLGPYAGRAARGGRLVRLGRESTRPDDADTLRGVLAACAEWLPHGRPTLE